MLNMNKRNISRTNEKSMNMHSQLEKLNNEIIHFLVDNGSLEEDTIENEN